MAIVGAAMQIAFWSIVLPAAITIIIKLFGDMVYAIGTFFFKIMDILQSVFRKLAGLGGSVKLQGEKSDDIVMLLLRSDVVIDTLISVTIFALGLVILASIVQMIRLEYNTEGSKNSKEQIFAKAGKSILMFILIPIVCFVGIRISNYLLQGIDYATSSSGASTVSGSVFAASTADASKVYDPRHIQLVPDLNIASMLASAIMGKDYGNAIVTTDGSSYWIEHFEDKFTYSGSSDFNDKKAGGAVRVALANQVAQAFTFMEGRDPVAESPGVDITGDNAWGTNLESWDKLSYLNLDAVAYFYNTGSINYLILFIGCYIGIKTLFTSSMGLIARLYKLGAMFVLAPAAIGLQPLDDGNAYKKWKSEFIKNVLACYGIIVALNLYFMLVGVLQTIELWEGAIFWVPNKFIQCLFVLTGATMIGEISSIVSGAIGAGDVNKDGEGVSKSVGDMAGKVQKFTAAPIAAGTQWAGSKMRQFAAEHNNREVVTDKDGKAVKADGFLGKLGVKKTRKVDSLAERRQALASAEKSFDDSYEKIEGDDGTVTYKQKGVEGAEAISEADFKKKKAEATKSQHDAVYNDKFAAQQAAKAGQHKIMAGMNANRMKSLFAENGKSMFSPLVNVMGGNQYATGKGFAGADEKYMKGVLKGVFGGDEQAFEDMMGTKYEDMPGHGGAYTNATEWAKSRAKKRDTVIPGASADRQIVTEYAEHEAGRQVGKQTKDQVVEKAKSLIDAGIDAQTALEGTGKKAQDKDGYYQADVRDTSILRDFQTAVQQFANGGSKDSFNTAVDLTKEWFTEGGTGSGRGNDGVKQMIQDLLQEIQKAGGTDTQAGRDAAQSFLNARFEGADLKAIIQDGDNGNKGYFNTEQQTAWDAAQKGIDAGNDMLTRINSGEIDEAITSGDASAIGKAIKEAIGADDGAIQQGFRDAMKGLEEALKQGSIKADMKDILEKKLKFDDSGVLKMMQDIKLAIEASAKKKGDEDGKTLKDILNQLKKNGSK